MSGPARTDNDVGIDYVCRDFLNLMVVIYRHPFPAIRITSAAGNKPTQTLTIMEVSVVVDGKGVVKEEFTDQLSDSREGELVAILSESSGSTRR